MQPLEGAVWVVHSHSHACPTAGGRSRVDLAIAAKSSLESENYCTCRWSGGRPTPAEAMQWVGFYPAVVAPMVMVTSFPISESRQKCRPNSTMRPSRGCH